jgi:hypothetical protein
VDAEDSMQLQALAITELLSTATSNDIDMLIGKNDLRHRQQITFTSGVEPASIAGWTMPNPRSLKSTKRFAV